MSSRNNSARIAIVMGSKSDWANGQPVHLFFMIAAPAAARRA